MKKNIILIIGLLLLPSVGFAEVPYECTLVKPEDIEKLLVNPKVVAAGAGGERSDSGIPVDLDGDGQLEHVILAMEGSGNGMIDTVIVKDSENHETIIYSIFRTFDETLFTIYGPVEVNNKPYVRVFFAKRSDSKVFDISYQGKGKFTACQISDDYASKLAQDFKNFTQGKQ